MQRLSRDDRFHVLGLRFKDDVLPEGCEDALVELDDNIAVLYLIDSKFEVFYGVVVKMRVRKGAKKGRSTQYGWVTRLALSNSDGEVIVHWYVPSRMAVDSDPLKGKAKRAIRVNGALALDRPLECIEGYNHVVEMGSVISPVKIQWDAAHNCFLLDRGDEKYAQEFAKLHAQALVAKDTKEVVRPPRCFSECRSKGMGHLVMQSAGPAGATTTIASRERIPQKPVKCLEVDPSSFPVLSNLARGKLDRYSGRVYAQKHLWKAHSSDPDCPSWFEGTAGGPWVENVAGNKVKRGLFLVFDGVMHGFTYYTVEKYCKVPDTAAL